MDKIGFVLDREDLIRFLGSDFGLPEGSFTTVPTMLLIQIGLLDGSVIQDPNFVLDPTEVAAIRQRVDEFNQIIAANAATVGAAVTDIGGMMSHAAIVCREYGLPAVTGTGSATTAIRTGQRIRVDGDTGTVTLLT